MSTTSPYVVQRRWEVFHFHPADSPPPLPAVDGGTVPVVNYDADGLGAGSRDMERGQEEQHWRSFDSSVNAVSFGFVATAILISMFLVMAIFERFLRPNSTDDPAQHHHHQSGGGRGIGRGLEGRNSGRQLSFRSSNKLGFPESPKMSVYSRGVSVLMPGEQIPTFIAHPVPVPSPPHRIDHINLPLQYYQPQHDHHDHNNNNPPDDPRHSASSQTTSFG